jgi:hypothetical protein
MGNCETLVTFILKNLSNAKIVERRIKIQGLPVKVKMFKIVKHGGRILNINYLIVSKRESHSKGSNCILL